MANSYVLRIAAAGIERKTLGQTVLLREIDFNILETLFSAAANTYKDAKSIHVCIDFLDQLRELQNAPAVHGKETEIMLDDMDKINLEKGIEATASGRPFGWFISGLWAQFDKMEPVKK